jgi:hypothetical protein
MAILKICCDDQTKIITDIAEITEHSCASKEDWDSVIICQDDYDYSFAEFPGWLNRGTEIMEVSAWVRHGWIREPGENPSPRENVVYLMLRFKDNRTEMHSFKAKSAYLMNDEGKTIDKF